jgi:hypothetical protein
MRGVLWFAALVWAASLTAAGDFKVNPAATYKARQEQAGVTVAVQPYRGEDEQKQIFDKAEPYKYGFLPVLLVITNSSDHALSLEGLKARFITSRREGLEPVSGEDLAFFNPPGHKPKDRPSYIPIPIGRPKARKGPLAKTAITQLEFQAPVIGPGTTVGGFFYYATGNEDDPIPGSQMYISGIRDLTTGGELFYFEIPLDSTR